MSLLCRIGLHKWVTKIGNFPGEDRWYRTEVCWRCQIERETVVNARETPE